MDLFKVDKMYKLPDAGNLKAFCNISIGDMIVIRGVRIMEGKKGLFVTLPREQGKDSKWYDQVAFKSTELFEDMNKIVLKEYKRKD